ncbi:hypothetical protein BU26DRAFT_581038 [Trematosphaeria pertusa]|uniref:Uncharacterized protein n=1 Tax=Trematosphaeria pertusa TaxID=390896 RepID=A0A6A6I097_9PLEO|nr:uncharacterized protein BU26DRAFT_581038 [Trematosphaeria pertusa]KAF2243875.1 hypothetical protein BU26DRAFT_581038 [Trematosphaeria pertusa]
MARVKQNSRTKDTPASARHSTSRVGRLAVSVPPLPTATATPSSTMMQQPTPSTALNNVPTASSRATVKQTLATLQDQIKALLSNEKDQEKYAWHLRTIGKNAGKEEIRARNIVAMRAFLEDLEKKEQVVKKHNEWAAKKAEISTGMEYPRFPDLEGDGEAVEDVQQDASASADDEAMGDADENDRADEIDQDVAMGDDDGASGADLDARSDTTTTQRGPAGRNRNAVKLTLRQEWANHEDYTRVKQMVEEILTEINGFLSETEWSAYKALLHDAEHASSAQTLFDKKRFLLANWIMGTHPDVMPLHNKWVGVLKEMMGNRECRFPVFDPEH